MEQTLGDLRLCWISLRHRYTRLSDPALKAFGSLARMDVERAFEVSGITPVLCVLSGYVLPLTHAQTCLHIAEGAVNGGADVCGTQALKLFKAPQLILICRQD